MLLKRILAGALCAVIAAGTAYYGVHYRFFDKPLSEEEQQSFEEQIRLPDGFILTASRDCFNTVRNTMQAVNDSVKTGAYAIELDVAFDADSVPYLAEGNDYITDLSVPLEKVFEKYANEPLLRYVLNIRNFATQDKLFTLAREYNLLDHIILGGFTLDDLREHIDDFNGFPIIAQLKTSGVNLHDRQQCVDLLWEYRDAGAGYIVTTADIVTPELLDAIPEVMSVNLVLRDVRSKYEMFQALSMNPRMIITDQPDVLYTIMFEGDHITFNF